MKGDKWRRNVPTVQRGRQEEACPALEHAVRVSKERVSRTLHYCQVVSSLRGVVLMSQGLLVSSKGERLRSKCAGMFLNK